CLLRFRHPTILRRGKAREEGPRLMRLIEVYALFASWLLLSEAAIGGLIVDPELLSSRAGGETQVTDSSFIPHHGPNDTIVITPKPAPSSFSLPPTTSSVSDNSGDSASAQVSFSYSYSNTAISSSGSASTSASFGNGRNLADGFANAG